MSMPPHAIHARHRQELRAVLRAGRLSRSQLIEQTGLRKNTVLSDIAALLDAGILREGDASVPTVGRPRTPLEIDPTRRHVIGLSIQPGRVQARRVNLLGDALAAPRSARAASPAQLLRGAKRLLAACLDEQTLMVGVTAPGFMDRQSYQLRFSAAVPHQTPVSLAPLAALTGDRPLVLENDVNAQAARWLSLRRPPQHRDTLFVALDDGRVGATLLIAGRPNRGSIGGANELGHNRLPVPTEHCYCGRTGCLERIFSTPFLRSIQKNAPGLPDAVAQADPTRRPAMRRVMELLACGIANAVNLLRVDALVLAMRLPRAEHFLAQLAEQVRDQTLYELVDQLEIEPYVEPRHEPADTAAQVALAHLFYEGW